MTIVLLGCYIFGKFEYQYLRYRISFFLKRIIFLISFGDLKDWRGGKSYISRVGSLVHLEKIVLTNGDKNKKEETYSVQYSSSEWNNWEGSHEMAANIFVLDQLFLITTKQISTSKFWIENFPYFRSLMMHNFTHKYAKNFY